MSPRNEAIERLAKVAQNATGSDWGWKGGKPGELTGGMHDSIANYLYTQKPLSLDAQGWMDNWYKENPKESRFGENDLLVAAQQHLLKTPEFRKRIDRSPDLVYETMEDFSVLEEANIPRAWTGKIVKALPPVYKWRHLGPFQEFDDPDAGFSWRNAAQALSDTMRPMTNEQRTTFLQLLPRWSGTLQTAASAAKKLYRRSS